MSRRISVGVIGLGTIAQIHHLPNLVRLQSRFRIVAVADISPRLTRTIADRLPGEVFCSTDWQAVCSHPDVEAVVVLTSGAHEQVTECALQAGKHVFAEKPLCLTVAGAERLGALASTRGLALQVGYMKLHERVLFELRNGLEMIGDPRLVRHSVFHPAYEVMVAHADTLAFDDTRQEILAEAAKFEQSRTTEALGDLPPGWGHLYRNVLAASFIHTVSFIRGVMGELPRLTFADLWPPSPPRPAGTPPSLVARGLYLDGSRVEMTWLWLPQSPGYRESFEVHGTSGQAVLQFPNPYLGDRAASLTVTGGDTVTRHGGRSESPFLRELRHFHEAITTGVHLSDASGAGRDTAFLQDMVAALATSAGLTVGGEAAQRR